MAKFRVGEKARIVYSGWPDWSGKEVRILGLPGCSADYPENYHIEFIGPVPVSVAELPGRPKIHAPGSHLQKLLPDTSSFKPADISIDDLMHTIKTPEVEHV